MVMQNLGAGGGVGGQIRCIVGNVEVVYFSLSP